MRLHCLGCLASRSAPRPAGRPAGCPAEVSGAQLIELKLGLFKSVCLSVYPTPLESLASLLGDSTRSPAAQLLPASSYLTLTESRFFPLVPILAGRAQTMPAAAATSVGLPPVHRRRPACFGQMMDLVVTTAFSILPVRQVAGLLTVDDCVQPDRLRDQAIGIKGLRRAFQSLMKRPLQFQFHFRPTCPLGSPAPPPLGASPPGPSREDQSARLPGRSRRRGPNCICDHDDDDLVAEWLFSDKSFRLADATTAPVAAAQSKTHTLAALGEIVLLAGNGLRAPVCDIIKVELVFRRIVAQPP